MSKQFVIYGFDKDIRLCPFCEKAKELIEENGDTYSFLNVVYDKEESNKEYVDRQRMSLMKSLDLNSLSGLTFPQIFYLHSPEGIRGVFRHHIGGYTELKKKYELEELSDLL